MSDYAIRVRKPWLGTFGDFFGGVLNPVLSFLSVMGLVIAIFLQRDQIILAKKEAEDASIADRSRAFEEKFFKMLGLFQDVLNAVDLHHENNKVTKGRDCFKVLFKRFVTTNRELLLSIEPLNDDAKIAVKIAYQFFYLDSRHEADHYFRMLLEVMRFLDKSDVDDKKFYAGTVRALLSQYEQLWLFYHAACCLPELKVLIEKYALFKDLIHDGLENRALLDWYELDAYGSEHFVLEQGRIIRNERWKDIEVKQLTA